MSTLKLNERFFLQEMTVFFVNKRANPNKPIFNPPGEWIGESKRNWIDCGNAKF